MNFVAQPNSFATLHAHLEQQRVMGEAEEENMTPYSNSDLEEGWEFKIIRSPYGAFGRKEIRERILSEERKGDWVLVEVFDDNRIRLKRRHPVKESLDDGYDPYRTVIFDHPNPAAINAIRIGCIVFLAIGAIFVGVLIATGRLK